MKPATLSHIAFLFVFCVGVGLPASIRAQQTTDPKPDTLRRITGHSLAVDIRPGYVFPTSGFFRGENAGGKPIDATLSGHLKYAFRFSPHSRLGRMYPHTYQGIGVAYNTFFNADEVGTPVAVYVFQGAPIVRLAPNLTLNYEWNFGVSFGWKKYDESTNLYNRVVGSPINAYINAGFYLDWRLAPQWRLTTGVDLAHYSNGNTHYPNAGVNTVSARVGLVCTIGRDADVKVAAEPFDGGGRICYDVVLYGSTRKRGVIGADYARLIPGSFGVAGLNFNPMYVVNRYFRAGLSLDAQYDESANLNNYVVESTIAGGDLKFYRPPFREQFGVGFSVRAELNMPVFSVNVGIGHNVFGHGDDLKGFYQILALKTFVTPRLFLHVGYQLSKFKDPNNLMLGLGYRFGG